MLKRLWPLALLAVVSGFTVNGFSLAHGTLYWDTGRLYPQFRDNLQSLNHFGEIAWWFPHNQNGIPGYYLSLLNTSSCLSPLFALLALAVWGLGRVGYEIVHYQPLYVFYLGFLQPFFFLWALDNLASCFFRALWLRLFLLGLAAFSPGIILNVSDIGFLEPTTYALFFGAAFLRFIGRPTNRTFYGLGISLLCLSLYLNNSYLYWNIVAIPSFILTVGFSARGRRRIRKAVSEIPPLWWLCLVGAMVICALPTIVTLTQGTDIVRTSLEGKKIYDFEKIVPGNPLELLTASLPGFGFDWRANRTEWTLIPFSVDYFSAYSYLGILALPLAVVGLMLGQGALRKPLFWWLSGISLVLCLSTYSPLFASLMVARSPLRACNHFSDVSFKAGGYLVLLFAATLGVKTLFQKTSHSRRQLTLWILIFSSSSMITHLYFREVAGNRTFGFLLCFTLLSLILLGWLAHEKKKKNRMLAIKWLVLLAILDASTQAFGYVRLIDQSRHKVNSGWPANVVIDDEPASNLLGLREGNHAHFYPNHFLMYRSLYEMIRVGLNPEIFPKAMLFAAAHIASSPVLEKQTNYESLGIGEEALAHVGFNSLLTQASPSPLKGKISVEKLTYNESIFHVESSGRAIFFFRDAYSPYWRAFVNGEEVPIVRAYYHFKAVAIPRGVSQIRFTFHPPWIALTLLAAYLCFGSWLVLGIFMLSTFQVPAFLLSPLRWADS